MGRLCDFCGEQRSIIHCRSDAACLCLSCDRSIHSANALSKRHLRTLLCERCHSQPAITRCIEESTSLCQECNWAGHADPPSNVEHKRQTINLYSGCPSAAEFSRVWPFFSVDESTCIPEPSLEEGNESPGQCQMQELETIAPEVEQFLKHEVISNLGSLLLRLIYESGTRLELSAHQQHCRGKGPSSYAISFGWLVDFGQCAYKKSIHCSFIQENGSLNLYKFLN